MAICLIVSLNTYAQVVVEALAGDRHVHYINYVDKRLDSSARWNFFNLNRFTVNYRDRNLNTVSIEGQLTYQAKSWFGVSIGGGFYGELFVPTIGLSLSYENKNEDFFIQMYPTVGIVQKQLVPSVLGIIGYTPKFNTNWGFSSQIIFSIDPGEASEIVRIGGDYKERIQFGVGVDMQQGIQTKNFSFNTGPFIRFNF